MNAIIRATAVDLAAKIKSRELSSVEVIRAHLERIEAVDPVFTPSCTSTVSGRCRPRRDRREDRERGAGGTARRCPARAQGCADLRRCPDDLRIQDSGGLDPAVRRDRDAAAARRRCGHRGQDQHGRVRHGVLDREFRVRADSQSVGAGPYSGRLRRRFGCVRWPRSRCRWRSARTPAARFASRQP